MPIQTFRMHIVGEVLTEVCTFAVLLVYFEFVLIGFGVINFYLVGYFIYPPMQPENSSGLLNFTLPSNSDIFIDVWFWYYVLYIGSILALLMLFMTVFSERYKILIIRFRVFTPFVVFPLMYFLIPGIEYIFNRCLNKDLPLENTTSKKIVFSLVCSVVFLVILHGEELWQKMNRKLRAVSVIIGCLVMSPLLLAVLCILIWMYFIVLLIPGLILSLFCLLILQSFIDDHEHVMIEITLWTSSVINLLMMLLFVLLMVKMTMNKLCKKRPRVTLVLILIIMTSPVLMYCIIGIQGIIMSILLNRRNITVSMIKKISITIGFSVAMIVITPILYAKKIVKKLQNKRHNYATLGNEDGGNNAEGGENGNNDVTQSTNVTIDEDCTADADTPSPFPLYYHVCHARGNRYFHIRFKNILKNFESRFSEIESVHLNDILVLHYRQISPRSNDPGLVKNIPVKDILPDRSYAFDIENEYNVPRIEIKYTISIENTPGVRANNRFSMNFGKQPNIGKVLCCQCDNCVKKVTGIDASGSSQTNYTQTGNVSINA